VLSKNTQKGRSPVLGVLSKITQKGGGPVLGVLKNYSKPPTPTPTKYH
jgi:hypothetical protein